MKGGQWPLLLAFAVSEAFAQAPLLQDGATALRQARLDWAQGQRPLEPSSVPSLEVGWGGAGSDGLYAPLLDGEGMGHGSQGWGLGLQGRYVRGGWSFAFTALGLRDHGSTRGTLHRAALAYQTESGWRVALEQAPFDWGVSLLGGELLGAQTRAFPRLSLITPEASILETTWRLETFIGRLESAAPIPQWAADRNAGLAARTAGLVLTRPQLQGAMLRMQAAGLLELGLGAISLEGETEPSGPRVKHTQALVEAKVRIPLLAQTLHARGATFQFSRSATPEGQALALNPARNLANLQLVWDGWDVGAEYAGPARPVHPISAGPFLQPTTLAGFSSHGDPLGDAYWRQAITRTVALGTPFFLEGQSHVRLIRATASLDQPCGPAAWFLQVEAQWRTSNGRLGASLASLRQEPATQGPRWGWSFSIFQAFRVF
ncbi:hypothetical protein [Geothrix sp. PMB-07]|uniref:hypothetical protein n=1 Tax=Geothrix sp. PMB-07 TaxID=3068640 RepID=UPI002741A352|nr:hypothetical protein [Geothrix sp. PMB-07]WLT33232.1 hypothetical protein Q9293_07830 [Geothrix sp. PMB-07]